MTRQSTKTPFPVTLNAEAIDALPVRRMSSPWALYWPQESMSGTHPPGHPTYHMQGVLAPRRPGAHQRPTEMVISGSDGRCRKVAEGTDLSSLYRPLPLEHPRVQAWITHLLCTSWRMYRGVLEHTAISPQSFEYPLKSYQLRRPELRKGPYEYVEPFATLEAEFVTRWNEALEQQAAALATPDNLAVTHQVREFYPDWSPPEGLNLQFPNPPKRPGLWWTTADVRPSAKECQGSAWAGHHRSGCLWCGRGTSRLG